MLELSAPVLESPKSALSLPQTEVPEDEEDYTGNEHVARVDGQPLSFGFPPWLLNVAIPGQRWGL